MKEELTHKQQRGVKRQRDRDCSQENGTLLVRYWSAHCTAIFRIPQAQLFLW